MKPRLERLEVLRALACIGVFTSHCYISSLGAWGVSVFIMLSGFLLVYNGLDRADSFPTGVKGCAGYAFRKIARLYPLYIFGLVLMVALSLVLSQGRMPMDALVRMGQEFLLCAGLLQAWVPVKGWAFSLNAVGWYVSASLVLYFVFPWILRRISRLSGAKQALLIIALVFAVMTAVAAGAAYVQGRLVNGSESAMEDFQHWFSYIFPLYRIFDFSIGCLLGFVFLRFDRTGLSCAGATALELAALALAVISQIAFRRDLLPPCFAYNALYVPSTALLVYAFALGKGHISRLLDFRLTRLIADYSVEVFLLHCVAIRYATPLVSFVPGPYVLQQAAFVVLNVGATVVAVLVWRWIGRRIPALAVR